MTAATGIAWQRATAPATARRCLSTAPATAAQRTARPMLLASGSQAGRTGQAGRQPRRQLPAVWFTATMPQSSPEPDHKPPDERTLKLGKTLRILQERLPTLLQSPLPSEILSPTISLHLFPSTHPHLPVVSGRVAYIAALWTSPLAWNRVPIVGNVRLEILSERMTKQPLHSSPRRTGAGDEQLMVRWRTIGAAAARKSGNKDRKRDPDDGSVTTSSSAAATSPLASTADPTKEFTGLFIFEFDGEGRILSHTIEHVEEGGEWERSVGARFVGLTDWLLGGMRGGSPPPVAAAFEMQAPHKLQ